MIDYTVKLTAIPGFQVKNLISLQDGLGAFSESQRLWTRTLGRSTSAALPEFVVSRMSGSPSDTMQERIQIKDTYTVRGLRLKFLSSPEIETRSPGYKAEIHSTMTRRRTSQYIPAPRRPIINQCVSNLRFLM